jgi:transcriptional regulator with XRE-family HTH domain
MQADRETFGPRLRSERERRGITLRAIAESTKIKESLFAELERSDLSKWPQGIFRRAHLCAYVSAIGLPQQPTLDDFLRLFPGEKPVEQADEQAGAADDLAAGPAASQTTNPGGSERRLADRAWVVAFDLAAVLLVSSILAAITGMSLSPAVAFVCLAYFAAGHACFGHSIGTFVQHQIQGFLRPRSETPIESKNQAPLREVRLVASQRKRTPPQRELNREPEVQQRRASA